MHNTTLLRTLISILSNSHIGLCPPDPLTSEERDFCQRIGRLQEIGARGLRADLCRFRAVDPARRAPSPRMSKYSPRRALNKPCAWTQVTQEVVAARHDLCKSAGAQIPLLHSHVCLHASRTTPTIPLIRRTLEQRSPSPHSPGVRILLLRPRMEVALTSHPSSQGLFL